MAFSFENGNSVIMHISFGDIFLCMIHIEFFFFFFLIDTWYIRILLIDLII